MDSLEKSTTDTIKNSKLYKFATDTLRLNDECSEYLTDDGEQICGKISNSKAFVRQLINKAKIPKKYFFVSNENEKYIINKPNISIYKNSIGGGFSVYSNAIEPSSVKVKVSNNIFKYSSDNKPYVAVEYYGKPILDNVSDADIKIHEYQSVKIEDANLSKNFKNVLNALKTITKKNSDIPEYSRYNTDLIYIPKNVFDNPGELLGLLEECATNRVAVEECTAGRSIVRVPLVDNQSVKIKVLDGIYKDNKENYYIPIEEYGKLKINPTW